MSNRQDMDHMDDRTHLLLYMLNNISVLESHTINHQDAFSVTMRRFTQGYLLLTTVMPATEYSTTAPISRRCPMPPPIDCG